MSNGLWFLLACFVVGCASPFIERAFKDYRVRSDLHKRYPWLLRRRELPLSRADRRGWVTGPDGVIRPR